VFLILQVASIFIVKDNIAISKETMSPNQEVVSSADFKDMENNFGP